MTALRDWNARLGRHALLDSMDLTEGRLAVARRSARPASLDAIAEDWS